MAGLHFGSGRYITNPKHCTIIGEIPQNDHAFCIVWSPKTHLANGPWNKSLNFIFPTKYVIPKSLSRLAIGQVS